MEQTAAGSATTASAEALIGEGVRLEAERRYEDAASALETGLAKAPEHATGQLHLGAILAILGRHDEAGTHLEKALELKPASPAFFLFAGRAFLDGRRHARAKSALGRALDLSPENDLVRHYSLLNRWDSGDQTIAGELDPAELPESNAFLARLLLLIEADLKGANVVYVLPGAMPPFLDRMRIAYLMWQAMRECKRGHFEVAAVHADTAAEICPGHPGALRLQKEIRQGALHAAQRRVQEDAASPEKRLELAGILTDEEQFPSASEQMTEALRLLGEVGNTDIVETPVVQGLCGRIAYGEGRFDEAMACFEKWAEPGFAMAEVFYYQGVGWLAKSERERALRAFEGLVARVCWAVPIRLREYQAWLRTRPVQPSEAQT